MKRYPCSSDRRYVIERINGRYILTFAGTEIANVSTLGQAYLRAAAHRTQAPPVIEQRA